MKPALRVLLVVVAAAVVTQAGAAAPARTKLLARPNVVIFWNARAGLLGVGYCARGVSRCAGGSVQRTNDGGRTFHIVLRSPKPIVDIERVGSRGAIAVPSVGEAWRTLDGGRTWRKLLFRPMFWASPRVSVRVDAYYQRRTQKLALRLSNDGARTFRRLANPCNQTVTYNAYLDLVTPKLWWMICVGQPAGGTMDKAIFRTRDAGKTWRAGAANLVSLRRGAHGGLGTYGYPNGLAFAKNGFGVVTESSGTLFITRDGGRNFHPDRKVDRPNLDYAAGAAAFSDGTAYVLLKAGLPARLLETHDFGRTWRVVRRWRS